MPAETGTEEAVGCGVAVGSRLGGSSVGAGGSGVVGLEGTAAAAAGDGEGAPFASGKVGVADPNCLIRIAPPRKNSGHCDDGRTAATP